MPVEDRLSHLLVREVAPQVEVKRVILAVMARAKRDYPVGCNVVGAPVL